MQYRYQRTMTILAAVGLLVGGHASAQDWGAQPAEPAQPMVETEWPAPEPVAPAAVDPAVEMQQLQMQLQQISMQLSRIQEQALHVQEVMDAIETYETRLRAKMVALAPDAETHIREAEGLVEELRAVQDPSALSPEEAEEFQEKYMQFLETTQRLEPIEREARMDPEMQDAQSELEELVKEAMRNVDPEADAILEEQEELIERYIELEQQQQQRRQQMAPPQDQPFEMPEM